MASSKRQLTHSKQDNDGIKRRGDTRFINSSSIYQPNGMSYLLDLDLKNHKKHIFNKLGKLEYLLC